MHIRGTVSEVENQLEMREISWGDDGLAQRLLK